MVTARHVAGRLGRGGIWVWEVSLQVISPERPNLRHQLQYTVQAADRAGAVRAAEQHARLDGQDVVTVVGVHRRHRI